MNQSQIDEEVCKILSVLEAMENHGIITNKQRSQLRTYTRAWAYDQTKLLEVTDDR